MSTPHELLFDDLSIHEQPLPEFNGRKLVVREASEDAAVKFQNASIRAAKFGPEGKLASVGDIAEVEPLLVHLCVVEQYKDNKGEPAERGVPLAEVKQWPARHVKKVFDWIKQVSGMNDDQETEEALATKIKELTEKLEAKRKTSKNDDPNSGTTT